MIPVFTTGPLEESIYQAWALPHLIDALRDPEIQLFNNHLSYYYNEKESHPEFPFIDQMGPDSPFSANGYNDLTKTLLKYAKNANLRKLAYPTDLRHAAAILTPSSTTFELFATFPVDAPIATSYLNRIRILTRDCYHAGIPNTDAELIKRTVRGGSNHSFYAASYQRFDADIRRAELNDEALPPFAELESHLLNIDESRGLTLPSQNQRNYNQHAHSTRQQSHHFQSRHPKLPIVFSHNVNNKLSAPSFAHIQTLMATIKTEVIHRDHRKTIRARSDLLQILRDHLSTTRINVAHHLLRLAHPTNPNGTIDHLSDQR
ncbi:hypothetical protein MHU86_18008 [Fragilaria crotonensis]|nr:hypothetical protein MHU86_18008 [Fragilaria crotonensis]